MQNKGNHFKLLAKVRAQQKKNYFHNGVKKEEEAGWLLVRSEVWSLQTERAYWTIHLIFIFLKKRKIEAM